MSGVDCPRAGRLFGGCKFSPRYDMSAPQPYEFGRGDSAAVCAILETSKSKTYVRDVCERCGKTIER